MLGRFVFAVVLYHKLTLQSHCFRRTASYSLINISLLALVQYRTVWRESFATTFGWLWLQVFRGY